MKLFVFARIESNGIHFFDAQGAAPVFVLSHSQVQLLLALAEAGGELEQGKLRLRLFRPSRRAHGSKQAASLPASARAAFARSLKQLEVLGLTERYKQKVYFGWGEQPAARLTEPGRAVIAWLMQEWDDWNTYQQGLAGRAG